MFFLSHKTFAVEFFSLFIFVFALLFLPYLNYLIAPFLDTLSAPCRNVHHVQFGAHQEAINILVDIHVIQPSWSDSSQIPFSPAARFNLEKKMTGQGI